MEGVGFFNTSTSINVVSVFTNYASSGGSSVSAVGSQGSACSSVTEESFNTTEIGGSGHSGVEFVGGGNALGTIIDIVSGGEGPQVEVTAILSVVIEGLASIIEEQSHRITGGFVALQVESSGAFFAFGTSIDFVLDTVGNLGAYLTRVVGVNKLFEGGDFATGITVGSSVFVGHVEEGVALGAFLGGLINLVTIVVGIDHLNTSSHISIEYPSIGAPQTSSS